MKLLEYNKCLKLVPIIINYWWAIKRDWEKSCVLHWLVYIPPSPMMLGVLWMCLSLPLGPLLMTKLRWDFKGRPQWIVPGDLLKRENLDEEIDKDTI